MRRYLLIIALAIAAPYLLSGLGPWAAALIISPEPVVLQHRDGTAQMQIIGAHAPWPAWTPVPASGTFAAKAWLGPSPNRPSSGYGEVTFAGAARDRAAAYTKQLDAAGWTTQVFRAQNGEPGPVVPYVIACRVHATRADGVELIEASFEVAPRAGRGSIHWTTPAPADRRAPPTAEPC